MSTISELIREYGAKFLAYEVELDPEYVQRTARYTPLTLNSRLAVKLSELSQEKTPYEIMEQYKAEKAQRKESTLDKIEPQEPIDSHKLVEEVKTRSSEKNEHPHVAARRLITDHYKLSRMNSYKEWSSLFGVDTHVVEYYESGLGKVMPPVLIDVLKTCKLTPYAIEQIAELGYDYRTQRTRG